MTLLATVQAPPAREMRAGLERKYRVEVVQEAGDQYAYRLRMRVVVPQLPKEAAVGTKAELRLELRLTDYRATMGEQTIHAPLIGGGETTVEPTGLPSDLNVTGPQGPVWLPLLSFYVPGGDAGPFIVPHIAVGGGLEMTGKGTLAKNKGGSQVEIEASFVAGSRTFGKLTLSTRLDEAGWPERATGQFVSEDGTYRFTLARA